ncbi:sigma-70 family RNA polymerase sigma factor, partial [Bacteroidales bacterium OttesenSCG-928-B11]|nr:sigma-70 family RNA polymerase sigma factor [Bacteroidales bacterium OttesenSCG-928-B11]
TDEEKAKDLLQDTYVKALSNIDKFKEASNLKAWTYTIMKNIFINDYRKNFRYVLVFDSSDEAFLLNRSRNSSDIEPDSRLREKELLAAVERLPEEYKAPFKLLVEGYKYREIADLLDMKLGTVKSRIYFARKQLFDGLQGYIDRC